MTIGKKALLALVAGSSGAAGLALRLVAHRRRQLVILAYHRIVDLTDEPAFGQDPELVSATVADFERQMRFVRAHFRPLRFSELLTHLQSGEPLPPRSLVVTFDDGHLDNYRQAFPVLRRLGVPACIFLSTDYIGSTRMFWFDRVAQLLRFAPAGWLRLGDFDVSLDDGDVPARREAAGALLRWLKQVPDAQRRAEVERLERELGQFVPADAVPERSALNWDEVREMARHGIEFGSHTCSHPILTRLDDTALKSELLHSRELIGREIGAPVRTIAYPVGKSGAFDDRVMAASAACGYELGISYETGTNDPGALQRFALRRLAVERYTRFSQFKSMLAFPALLA